MDFETRLNEMTKRNDQNDSVLAGPLDLNPKKVVKKSTSQVESTDAKRVRLRKKVKGIFHFYEVPQGSMSFVYKEFKNDPLETYHFIDGQIYEIPLGVAMHLANSGKHPQYQYSKDQDGKVSVKIEKKISRYGFESLEFISNAELNNELL